MKTKDLSLTFSNRALQRLGSRSLGDAQMPNSAQTLGEASLPDKTPTGQVHFTVDQLETIWKAASIPGVRISFEMADQTKSQANITRFQQDLAYKIYEENGFHGTSTASMSDCISTSESSSSFYDLAQDLDMSEQPLSITSYSPIDASCMHMELNESENLSVNQSLNSPEMITEVDCTDIADSFIRNPVLDNSQYSKESFEMSLSRYPSTLAQPNHISATSACGNNIDNFFNEFAGNSSQLIRNELYSCGFETDQARPSTLRYSSDQISEASFPTACMPKGPTLGGEDSESRTNSFLGISSSHSPGMVTGDETKAESSRQMNPKLPPVNLKVNPVLLGVITDSNTSRRGPFKSETERAGTALVRKNKACLLCRQQKIRCTSNVEDPAGICMQCSRVETTMSRLPCLRYKITDTLMNRQTGFAPSTAEYLIQQFRWNDMTSNEIQDFSPYSTQWIEVTQDYGTSIRLPVNLFTPIGGEELVWRWLKDDGEIGEYETPPFAIANIGLAKHEIEKSMANSLASYVESTLDESNSIVWSTFSMIFNVLRNQPENDLLREVLQFWVACRLSEGLWRICGPEVLGMSPQRDTSCHFSGQIPLPPVMQEQVYRIVLNEIIGPLRKSVLTKYQALISSNKPRNWFTLYLATFALTHNLERVIANNKNWARWWKYKEKFCNFAFVEEILSGSRTILAHFHYCCKGQMPFTLNWETSKATLAELNWEERCFMVEVCKEVKRNEKRFQVLREKERCGEALTLAAQVFDSDWKPTTFLL